MKKCKCGGMAVRRSIDVLVTGGAKIRYRCKCCMQWMSIYHDALPTKPREVVRGKNGRPAYVE